MRACLNNIFRFSVNQVQTKQNGSTYTYARDIPSSLPR
jgi:hypothetical protein